ncbi:MAG: PKD domain-containing protein, partial [Thermoplasmata archaeon]
EIQVIVNINYPPVYVDASIPLQVFTDTICKFSVNFTDPKNETLNYTWYLNGDVIEQGNTIEHVFRNPGTYTLKVVVTDGVHTVECSWNITVNQKVEAKGIGDFLPWLIPTALIILLVVVVVTLMRRKEKEAVRKPPAEEGGVVAESPGIPEEVHVEEEEAEYGITPEIEKKIKAYVKQNPGIYLTKLASDIAAEHGMREVDVITAVQMMEVDGDLTLQVDEEGKTRVYPP